MIFARFAATIAATSGGNVQFFAGATVRVGVAVAVAIGTVEEWLDDDDDGDDLLSIGVVPIKRAVAGDNQFAAGTAAAIAATADAVAASGAERINMRSGRHALNRPRYGCVHPVRCVSSLCVAYNVGHRSIYDDCATMMAFSFVDEHRLKSPQKMV